MLMMAVMSTLCMAGVGFYVRFVVALCKECKPRRSGHWMLLRIHDPEESPVEVARLEQPVTRAA